MQKLHRLGILASIIKHSHHHPICTFEKVCTFGNSFSQMYCKYYMVDFSTVQNARSSREELQTFSPQGRISVRLLSMLVRKKFFSLILKSQFYLKTFLLRLQSKFTNKYSLNCSYEKFYFIQQRVPLLFAAFLKI